MTLPAKGSGGTSGRCRACRAISTRRAAGRRVRGSEHGDAYPFQYIQTRTRSSTAGRLPNTPANALYTLVPRTSLKVKLATADMDNGRSVRMSSPPFRFTSELLSDEVTTIGSDEIQRGSRRPTNTNYICVDFAHTQTACIHACSRSHEMLHVHVAAVFDFYVPIQSEATRRKLARRSSRCRAGSGRRGRRRRPWPRAPAAGAA